jgi:hypothetical protein
MEEVKLYRNPREREKIDNLGKKLKRISFTRATKMFQLPVLTNTAVRGLFSTSIGQFQ